MDWLNFHHLRYFWVVAREGSLRAAAERLSVSQPSISAQLKLLEDALGHPLFKRTGRALTLTETGRLTLGYAEQIFSTGRELMEAVRGQGDIPPMFHVGVTDSLPKPIVREMLEPVLQMPKVPRLACHEGRLEELLPLLAAHRLDLVLADEPAAGVLKFKVFNHPLGSCGVTFCASPKLAKQLRKGFPRSLHGAPMLLPGDGTQLRRAVEQWLAARQIVPRVLGEFDDLALMKMFARDGLGFIPLHSVAVKDALKTFALAEVGDAPECRCHLHAITAERRLRHAAVLAVTGHAQGEIFG